MPEQVVKTEAESQGITRVALRNYKSIAACDIELAPLTVLVGPNGAGKSNFVDALRFTAQALRFSLDHALRERGGVNEVRRRSRGHPNHFGIRLDYRLPESRGWYAFEIGAKPKGRYIVRKEECVAVSTDREWSGSFRIENGRTVASTFAHPPNAGNDRLYLMQVAGYPPFRPIYDALAGMGFYNLHPEQIRELQSPDPGDLLKADGSNIASVLARLKAGSPERTDRMSQYLSMVVPGTVGMEPKTVGPKLTVEFRQEVRGDANPWRFLANNVSDGTLRVLGVLVALYQGSEPESGNAMLVGIEEPESALHPAAAGVLTDVLLEASERIQVVVTSHSADLLDRGSIPLESIVAVVSENGETRIAPLDDAGRKMLRDHLFTAGELLRMDQLTPDPELSAPRQLNLFRGGT